MPNARFSFISRLAFIASLLSLTFFACGEDEVEAPPPPPKTILEILVVDADSQIAIADARVIVQNGDSAAPIQVLSTDAEGVSSLEINEAVVSQALLLVSAQGYISSPPTRDAVPIPHAVPAHKTTVVTIELTALADASALGSISGTVFDTDGMTAIDGALVIATGATAKHSVASAGDGSYVIFNVPAETVTVDAWKAAYNFPEVADVSVTAEQTTVDVDITSSGAASGSITGQISFLAAANSIVDITLLHPATGDVIPGLRTFNDDTNSFSLVNVPDGEFHATASFESDGYVLDPDSLVKFGVPTVTVSGGSAESIDFDVTDSVTMRMPTSGETLAFDSAVFEWLPYSSSSDYVVEVSDVSGNIIWGGFDTDKAKLFMVDAGDTLSDPNTSETYLAATFNSDGNATEALQEGKKYRVRIYASKDVNVNQDALGYKLISASEGLVGVFTAGPAQ